jgi:putative PIN family toxin of toxin-antitoxin system
LIVVFDSGVWISAFQFRGTPRKALDSATGQVTIALCAPILAEVHSVLKAKFQWQSEDIDEALAEYDTDAIIVAIFGSIRGCCRDSKDDMVLECALLAGAAFIVTRDKDLLTLSSFRGIRILSPRDFLTIQEAKVSGL